MLRKHSLLRVTVSKMSRTRPTRSDRRASRGARGMPLPSTSLSSGHHPSSAFDRTNLELGEACKVGRLKSAATRSFPRTLARLPPCLRLMRWPSLRCSSVTLVSAALGQWRTERRPERPGESSGGAAPNEASLLSRGSFGNSRRRLRPPRTNGGSRRS